MSEPWRILRMEDVDPIAVAGVHWQPLRRTLGIDAFGINAYTALEVGEHVVEEHTEEQLGHQEVYLVLQGHATFTLDGEHVDAPAGSIIFLGDPGVRRSAVAEEVGTTVLAIGGVPGVHEPSAWEWYFEAERYRDPLDVGAAQVLLAEGRARFPQHAGMLYASACWAAIGGDSEQAMAWLHEAIVVDPNCADWAKDDADLDPIRGLPGSPV